MGKSLDLSEKRDFFNLRNESGCKALSTGPEHTVSALDINDNLSLSPLFPSCCFSLQQWFSTRSDFVFPGHTLVVTSGGGCYWFYAVEARGAATHPPMHRTAPTTKHPPAHDVRTARMRNLALAINASPKLELSL